MDWIHCNKCFTQPGEQKDKKLWLTNCGHMFCDDCLARGPNGTFGCHTCKKICNTQQLTSSNLNGELKEYFSSFHLLLEKALKVRDFQNDHRLKLAQYNKHLDRKQKNLAKQCKDLYDDIHHLQEKISQLENENNALRNMRASSSSTPNNFQFLRGIPQSNSSYLRGNSGLYTPQSSHMPQRISLSKSAGACTQQTPPQKLTCNITPRTSLHPTPTKQGLPLSRSSNTQSINVNSAKKSYGLPYFMSPSPASSVKHSNIQENTPEYVSQLQGLSFLNRSSIHGSGI